MGQLTLEKKIAQLPDVMKLKLEEYVDAMMDEMKKLHKSTSKSHRQFGGGKIYLAKLLPTLMNLWMILKIICNNGSAYRYSRTYLVYKRRQ
jgi:hypothetical protein